MSDYLKIVDQDAHNIRVTCNMIKSLSSRALKHSLLFLFCFC